MEKIRTIIMNLILVLFLIIAFIALFIFYCLHFIFGNCPNIIYDYFKYYMLGLYVPRLSRKKKRSIFEKEYSAKFIVQGVEYIQIKDDPRSHPLDAPISSMARLYKDGVEKIFIKTGNDKSDWTELKGNYFKDK